MKDEKIGNFRKNVYKKFKSGKKFQKPLAKL